MPIPSYDELMLPVLRFSAQKTWQMGELVNRVADELGLTPEEREQQIPSGAASVIGNRVQWAKTYLKKAGLIEQPKRGMIKITPRGTKILDANPDKVDNDLLWQFPEFRSFLSRTKAENGLVKASAASLPATPSVTPEEQIATASKTLDESLRDALLTRLLECSPTFFEKLIIDLLLAMGYGGSRTDAGRHLGRSGDGGVDGVIREDQLGLDRVYLQAKRFQPGNTVSSEAVQAFIGALIGQGAQKGVLITTSTFSKAATEAANRSGAARLVLIDGEALTNLMVRFNVGVRVAQTVDIKRVDLDYFEGSEPE